MKFDATYVLVKSDTTYVAVDASTVTGVLMAAGDILFGQPIQDYCNATYFAENYVQFVTFSPY